MSATGKKIQVAGSSHCMFTKLFSQKLDKADVSVKGEFDQLLMCSGASASNSACALAPGFPSMVYDGTLCHVGYGDPADVLCKCIPTHGDPNFFRCASGGGMTGCGFGCDIH